MTEEKINEELNTTAITAAIAKEIEKLPDDKILHYSGSQVLCFWSKPLDPEAELNSSIEIIKSAIDSFTVGMIKEYDDNAKNSAKAKKILGNMNGQLKLLFDDYKTNGLDVERHETDLLADLMGIGHFVINESARCLNYRLCDYSSSSKSIEANEPLPKAQHDVDRKLKIKIYQWLYDNGLNFQITLHGYTEMGWVTICKMSHKNRTAMYWREEPSIEGKIGVINMDVNGWGFDPEEALVNMIASKQGKYLSFKSYYTEDEKRPDLLVPDFGIQKSREFAIEKEREDRLNENGTIKKILLCDLWALSINSGLRLVARSDSDFNKFILISLGSGEVTFGPGTDEELKAYLEGNNSQHHRFTYFGRMKDVLTESYADEGFSSNMADLIVYREKKQ